ncbi:MAG: DHHA1 domain-containing protein, partial [Proteocatella sp.]
ESQKLYLNKIIITYMPDIHESIAGIVASRIKDKYNRPVIVFADSEELIKGSARSIEEVNIFDEISKHKDLLLKFGGHPMAAGMSLEKHNFDAFYQNLTTEINKLDFSIQKTYRVDLLLEFDEIDHNIAEKLKLFEPYGKGNEKIIFSTKDVSLLRFKILGKNCNVLKLEFEKSKKTFEFITFGDISLITNIIKNKVQINDNNDIISSEMNNFDILYSIGTNVFNGVERLQLELISIR